MTRNYYPEVIIEPAQQIKRRLRARYDFRELIKTLQDCSSSNKAPPETKEILKILIEVSEVLL